MKANLTVRYNSGREDRFEVELYGSGKSAEFRLKDFAKDPALLLQTESELILIPAAAIECITISLPQSEIEEFGLKNVRKATRLRNEAE